MDAKVEIRVDSELKARVMEFAPPGGLSGLLRGFLVDTCRGRRCPKCYKLVERRGRNNSSPPDINRLAWNMPKYTG